MLADKTLDDTLSARMADDNLAIVLNVARDLPDHTRDEYFKRIADLLRPTRRLMGA